MLDIIGVIFLFILAVAALIAIRIWWAYRKLTGAGNDDMVFYKGNLMTKEDLAELQRLENEGLDASHNNGDGYG